MEILFLAYDVLKNGDTLSVSQCESIKHLNCESFQLASLAVQILAKKNKSECEENLLEWILQNNHIIYKYLFQKFKENSIIQGLGKKTYNPLVISEEDIELINVLISTNKNSEHGYQVINRIVAKFINNNISLDFMAIWLMIITIEGLSRGDVDNLTKAMINSGDVFDYRKLPELNGRKIIRRYPTGALSEKVALILPSLISAFSYDFPIATAFLVAKSLGFTGGTWDKLNSIPGFWFPAPGLETIETLKQCNAAMSVTKDTFNPADRLMYQFRSLTGTIESKELIVASIASKQLACPPDELLLDIRYGNGAFMRSKSEAERLADLLVEVIEAGGVHCLKNLMDTTEPDGVSIGNGLEVAEAVAIISNNPDPGYWDLRALNHQKDIVIYFFSLMMDSIFPNKGKNYWKSAAQIKFDEGTVLKAFKAILLSHKVDESVIINLTENPCFFVEKGSSENVFSERKGIVREIDQRRLGYIVNFDFNAGGNIYYRETSKFSGIILRKRLGDHVQKGSELCKMVNFNNADRLIITKNSVLECFIIG